MAVKRHANDRNEQVIQAKRMVAENLDELVLEDGLVIKLRNIDPIFVQTVINSVEFPKKPTYEVKLASGRIEHYPMDALVAEQSPELEPIWTLYKLEQARAETEQMKRMTRALILDGTIIPDQWDDPRWERRMKIVGIELPDDPEERWVMYVESKMKTEETVALTNKIMRRTGVPEEYLTATEDTFRDQIHAGSQRPGNVADAGADQGNSGRGDTLEVETQ